MNLSKTYSVLLASAALVAASCTKETAPESKEPNDSIVGSEIVFCSSGAETKADVSPMVSDGRFVCKMYYHSEVGATESTPFIRTDTVITWFKVSGTSGNSLYWNKEYTEPAEVDTYGDTSATRFYWKNRHQHAFLALADNNKLLSDTGSGTGTLQMSDTESYITRDDGRYYFNTYYLIKKKDESLYSSMSEQPDPMLAFTKQIPEKSTVEGNRVSLNFEHQFSLVQINLTNSGDGSVTLNNPSSVQKVELLGTSEIAYVPHQMRTNGEIYPTFAKKVDLSKYTEEQLKDNPYGTSMSMFRKSTVTGGTLTGFEAIAAGSFHKVRVTWNEEIEGNVQHKIDFTVPTDLDTLIGGKKYVYTLELRRSSLVLIRDEISKWTSGSTYGSEGIQK